MYTQVIYCLERVAVLAKAKPDLKDVEPFRTVLSGNREAMAKFTMPDLEEILAATLTGMTVGQFGVQVKDRLGTAKHPRFKRPYTELVYQPMLEVMRLFRANGYKTYFVTGAARISCACTRSRCTAFRLSRWSARRGAPSSGTTTPAGRCAPRSPSSR